MTKTTLLVICLVTLGAMVTPARAEICGLYGFSPITTYGDARDTIAAQLSVEVTAYGTDQVLFTFNNSGGATPSDWVDGSITDIYFDDGTLFGLAGVVEGPGVDFAQYAKPGNLQGGVEYLEPDFVTTAGFSADSESPIPENGVSPGESVGILFDLQDGKTLWDVFVALGPAPGAADSLRIGIHVQGIGGPDGDSGSFIAFPVAVPLAAVPVPAATVLGVLGLGVAGWRLRKFV